MWALAYFLVFAAVLTMAAAMYYGHLHALTLHSYAEELYGAKLQAASAQPASYSDFASFSAACRRGEAAVWVERGRTLGRCASARVGRAEYRFTAYVVDVERGLDWRGAPAYVVALYVSVVPPHFDLGFYVRPRGGEWAEAPSAGWSGDGASFIYYVPVPPGAELKVADWPFEAVLNPPPP